MAEHCNVNDTGLSQYQKENKELGAWVIEKYFYDVVYQYCTKSNQSRQGNYELKIQGSVQCNHHDC